MAIGNSLDWTKTVWWSVLTNGKYDVWKCVGFNPGWYYNDMRKHDRYTGSRGPFTSRKAAIKAAEAEAGKDDRS